MAYTEEQYAAARDWATGKTGDVILNKAQELGLTASDLAGVFGTGASNIMAASGYGTDAGLNSDVGQFTYLGGSEDGGQWKKAQQPMMQRGGGVNLQAYTKNPYLDQMAAGITQQATRNLNENILPGVRSQAVASGGYGGSRQGIAEGLAMGRTNDALTNSLANLYGTDYNNQMNRNLQQYGMDQQYNLGLGGLDMQGRGLDLQQQSINNQYNLGQGNLAATNRGIDNTYNLGLRNADNARYATDKSYDVGMANASAAQSSASAAAANAANNYALGQQQLGMNSLFGLLDRQQTYNQNGLSSANNIQNTPLNYWQQFSQGANSIGQGYGTSTASGGGGNPLAGALGGWQLGSQLGNSFGGGGWGTGNAFGNQDLGSYL